MSKLNETMIPTECYVEDKNADGSPIFICKQRNCDKSFKKEQGVKAHIKAVHKTNAIKRTISDVENDEEKKKARIGLSLLDTDVDEFEREILGIETSSQVDNDELDKTDGFCSQYLNPGGNDYTNDQFNPNMTVDHLVKKT